MVNRRLRLWVGLAIVLAGMAVVLLHPTHRVAQSPVDEIREAVFRYQFQHNGSRVQGRATAYYLSFAPEKPSHRDNIRDYLGIPTDYSPSDHFIRRFRSNAPPVKKESQCNFGVDGVVVDKSTRARGLLFCVSSVRLISKTKAEAKGGYFETGCSASTNTYTVELRMGRWVVVRDRLDGIS
jgi:hypothetical protein